MEELSVSKMDASAQRVIDSAISAARQHRHRLLTNEHIFLAFARLEWHVFSQLLRDAGTVPQEVVREVKDSLSSVPTWGGETGRGAQMRVAPATKLLFKLAFHHAARAGRQTIQAIDLFSAIFEESQGVPASVLRRRGVEPEVLISAIATHIRESELGADRRRFPRQPAIEPEAAPPTAPIAAAGMFEEADRRWAAEEADKARAWPDPPRTFRRRLLDLMGFRARTNA